MRYLKLYEQLSNSYEEISKIEFYKIVIGNGNGVVKFAEENWHKFTPSDMQLISQLSSINDIKTFYTGKAPYLRVRYSDPSKSDFIYREWTKPSYSIFKLKDEWFYLRLVIDETSNDNQGDCKYYKCDQIDGLIDCIKSEALPTNEGLYNNIDAAKLYKQIYGDRYPLSTEDDDNSYIKSYWIPFTAEEISKLENLLKRDITWSGGMQNENNGEIIFYSKNKKISIFKLKDEWYYLSKFSEQYQCDQFDGLVECIKDKILNS